MLSEPAMSNDLGNLTANGMMVKMLQTALSRAETNAGSIPGLIRQISEQEMWRSFCFSDGNVFRWNAADFRQFIEAPRPAGCQTKISLVRRMLADTPEADMFEDLIRGRPGNPSGTNQHTSGKCDNVTLSSSEPDTIPLSPDVPRPQRTDRARKPPTGHSVSYSIRRLKDNRPDLLDKVQSGELSYNAAMIEGGFKQREFSIPDQPEAAVRRIVKNFKGDDLIALVRGLAHAAGMEVLSP